jgi:hypothetical protein
LYQLANDFTQFCASFLVVALSVRFLPVALFSLRAQRRSALRPSAQMVVLKAL